MQPSQQEVTIQAEEGVPLPEHVSEVKAASVTC